jgi:hypothetical protein
LIVLVTLTIGLVIWILAWSFGFKSFDAFLFMSTITLIATGVRIALPHVDRRLRGTPAPGER